MAQSLGKPIALGSRSVVHAWGPNAVAKVPIAGVPDGWIRFEAVYTDAVRSCGAPAPKMLGIEVLNGREISIYERVDGPSMWDSLVAEPARARTFGRELAGLQIELLSLTAPVIVPLQRTRLLCKIREAARSVDRRLASVAGLVPTGRSNRLALCHGDLHPKNVILGANGPIVVDWFDVSRGDACGDVARTSLLLNPGQYDDDSTKHLPGASRLVLDELHDAYFETIRNHFDFASTELQIWRTIEATARLSEGVEPGPLLAEISGSYRLMPTRTYVASSSSSNVAGVAAKTSPSFSGQGSSTDAPASSAISAPAAQSQILMSRSK